MSEFFKSRCSEEQYVAMMSGMGMGLAFIGIVMSLFGIFESRSNCREKTSFIVSGALQIIFFSLSAYAVAQIPHRDPTCDPFFNNTKFS